MLPPFIIEELRRREQHREQQEQPRLELPLPTRRRRDSQPTEGESDQGVTIIPLWG